MKTPLLSPHLTVSTVCQNRPPLRLCCQFGSTESSFYLKPAQLAPSFHPAWQEHEEAHQQRQTRAGVCLRFSVIPQMGQQHVIVRSPSSGSSSGCLLVLH